MPTDICPRCKSSYRYIKHNIGLCYECAMTSGRRTASYLIEQSQLRGADTITETITSGVIQLPDKFKAISPSLATDLTTLLEMKRKLTDLRAQVDAIENDPIYNKLSKEVTNAIEEMDAKYVLIEDELGKAVLYLKKMTKVKYADAVKKLQEIITDPSIRKQIEDVISEFTSESASIQTKKGKAADTVVGEIGTEIRPVSKAGRPVKESISEGKIKDILKQLASAAVDATGKVTEWGKKFIRRFWAKIHTLGNTLDSTVLKLKRVNQELEAMTQTGENNQGGIMREDYDPENPTWEELEAAWNGLDEGKKVIPPLEKR